jgi:hypothetical protein
MVVFLSLLIKHIQLPLAGIARVGDVDVALGFSEVVRAAGNGKETLLASVVEITRVGHEADVLLARFVPVPRFLFVVQVHVTAGAIPERFGGAGTVLVQETGRAHVVLDVRDGCPRRR